VLSELAFAVAFMFAWGWDEFGLDADDDDGWEEGKEGNGGSFARVDERVFGSSNAWNVLDDGWMDDRKIKDSDSL
jgi:hypothetical protein